MLLFASDRLVAQTADSSSTPRLIQSTEEILPNWDTGQRLYVKGDLGLGTQQLAELEQWLDQNGTNWVVVLMDTAAGENYTEPSGQRHTGMDAVEYRLGNGLPNRTSFGSWTDTRTGERNGAFFVLFLNERKFSYYGSDAQDKRGLGEDAWIGRLDAPAIAAMRSGGRIIDAAKDTVSSINRQLDEKIAAEERQRQQAIARAEARRAELEARARELMETAGRNLSELESETIAMREADPQLTGEIVNPDFASWRAQLVSAKTNFENGDFQAAATIAELVNSRVADASRELEDYKNAGTEIDGFRIRLDELEKSPHADHVRPLLDSVEHSLSECRQAHNTADPSYRDLMTDTRDSLDTAQSRIQSQIRSEKLARDFLMVSTGSGVVLILLAGFVMSRRRRSSRNEALELIGSWDRALEEKSTAASELMIRSFKTLGASRTEAEEHFSGDTLALVQQTIRDVDEMMIMATCAKRVLKDAEALAQPETPTRRAANLFFKRRYLAAVRKLRDEPIVFQPEEGLADALREKRTDRERLLGTLDSYQPFKLSFNELIASFNERAERAFDALDRIEQGELKIADLLIEVQGKIEETRTAAEALEKSEAPEGLFPVGEILTALLPSALEDYSEAAVMSIGDPLRALETAGARASEQVEDASRMLRLAANFHEKTEPALLSVREKLASLKLGPGWIEEALEELSETFVATIATATRQASSESIELISENLEKLVERAGQTTETETHRVENVLPAIKEETARVGETRAKIGRELGLDASQVLNEDGRNPDDFLSAAQAQADASFAASNRGDVDAANAANARALREVEFAGEMVDRTRSAFESHDETLKARAGEADRLQAEIPAHQSILETLESRYAASVFLLGAGDPTHPDANGTIKDNLGEVRELMDAAANHLQSAKEWFALGKILDSADALDQAEGCQKLVASRLQEIKDKQSRLQKAEAENRSSLAHLQSRIEGLKDPVRDARTMPQTEKQYAEFCEQCKTLATEIDATGNDPFQLAEKAEALKLGLDGLESAIASDWDLHQEAVRSVAAGEEQLNKLGELSDRVSRDDIPDSPTARDIVSRIDGLNGSLIGLKARLEEPHGNWDALDRDADDFARQAGLLAATLRNDLQSAQEAHQRLREAAEQVRSAGLWSGSYGVSISGRPGMDALDRARQNFAYGNYAVVLEAALLAKRVAFQAIAEASAEVQRRERAERQRLERERRQRELLARQMRQATSRSSSGSSSFGSGSRRSSFSSRSGSSRSSFRSGSGSRRSGW